MPVLPRPYCDAHAEFLVRRHDVPVVAIGSLTEIKDEIRAMAHKHWVREGKPDGRADIHWAMACHDARDWYVRSTLSAWTNLESR